MGLDVYLYQYSDRKKSKENEEVYDKLSERLYSALDGIEDEELVRQAREGIREKLSVKAGELGLGEWGEDITYRKKIEQDSVLHPDHMFKIGYFRSSYNESGINGILKNMGVPDLYDIFCPGDDYEFCPDWSYALSVVNESIELLKKDKGYRVTSIAANLFSQDEVPVSPAAALDIFKEQLDKNGKNKNFTAYSNRYGEFYLDKKGMAVHGLIPGKDMFQRPCTFVVYKTKDGNKYYLEALEIVKETIEYVLAQDNPQEFYMSWSG